MKSSIKIFFCITLILCSGCNTQYKEIYSKEYSIVISSKATSFELNSANYLKEQIYQKKNINIQIIKDNKNKTNKEIVIGKTNREISKQAMNVEMNKFESVIISNEEDIAIYGEDFMVANSSYNFIDKYLLDGENVFDFNNGIKKYTPEPKKAKNLFLLIGDGMGEEHTKLLNPKNTSTYDFFAYRLPYYGTCTTSSLSGVTDSAAAATALACGVKTTNGKIGKNENDEDVQSLTELALSKSIRCGILSTDILTGATPASFLSHASSRNDTSEIYTSIYNLFGEYKDDLLFESNFVNKTATGKIKALNKCIKKLENDKGFFIMYEEAYIDKNCSNNDIKKTKESVSNFNSVIGAVLEYSLFNPDTLVIVTADHETGDLTYTPEFSDFIFNTTSHTNKVVPIFAYGKQTEIFNDKTVDNIDIHTFYKDLINNL